MPGQKPTGPVSPLSRRRLDDIFSQPLFECIFVHENGIAVAINPTLTSVLGYDEEDTIGKPVIEFVASNCRPEMEHRLESGQEGYFVVTAVHKEGHEVIMEATSRHIDVDGRRLVVVHMHDVTDLRVLEDTVTANKQELQRLEAALRRKDEALKEFLWQLRDKRQQVAVDIQSNINKIVKPLLRKLEEKADERDRHSLQLVSRCLDDITSPFVSVMESKFSALTPREMEICNMIKNGFRSKEIAATLNISIQTVLTQRKLIRRKLDIANKSVNLVTYLNNLDND